MYLKFEIARKPEFRILGDFPVRDGWIQVYNALYEITPPLVSMLSLFIFMSSNR